MLGHEALSEIAHGLVDEDTAGDMAFFLYAITSYAAVRIATELLFPGVHRGYTHQQYILTIAHQAVLLPLIAVGWAFSWSSREGSSFVYLLTGAYMASDSMVNNVPVSGCVANLKQFHPGYESHRTSVNGPLFSWAIHAHHFFTVFLCLLGSALPPWLEDQGAVCIMLGEAGSLWITVTLLWPTPTNFILRFYSYLTTRIAGVVRPAFFQSFLEPSLSPG